LQLALPAISGEHARLAASGAGASMSEDTTRTGEAPKSTVAPKNIVLLSDGTGNSSSKLFKTNVWRMFQTLDLTDASKQIAYYDNGVGTSSFKLFAILGGVFGFGLKRNVIAIYSFCCRNYVPGDKIYGFGFSRGAFTMRVVAGLIAHQGLVPYKGDEIALARYAANAYRDYRRRFNSTEGLVTPLRGLRDIAIRAWRGLMRIPQYDKTKQVEVDSIHFLGLWDTVDAYGGPIEEITRAIDYWYWPLSMPDRFMNAKVHRACHALALEDERDAFRPVVWDERYVRRADDKLHDINSDWTPDVSDQWRAKLKPIDDKRLSQVWFVGVHSDVGGGYPQDGLSYVTLDWMLDRAQPFGLLLDQFQHDQIKSLVNPYDKLNDSRHGFAGYYRYKPRNIREIYNSPPYKPSISRDFEYMRGELIRSDPKREQKDVVEDLAETASYVPPPPPTIHRAVFDRLEATHKPEATPPFEATRPFSVATDGYVPITLPAAYRITDEGGELSPVGNLSTDKDGQLQLNIQYQADRDGQPLKKDRDSLGSLPDDQTQKVWNMVWWRRIVYFLTMFASVALAAVPLMDNPTLGADTPLALLRPLIALAAAFLPSLLSPWLQAYSAAPGYLVLGGVVVLALLAIGGWLQRKIRDEMRAIWIGQPLAAGPVHAIAFWIRTQPAYRIFFYWLKHQGLPSLFAALILWAIVALASQVIFRTADSLGAFCVGDVAANASQSAAPIAFDPKNICGPTRIRVLKDEDYKVTIMVTSDWLDNSIPTDPQGFGFRKMSLLMYPTLPFRRIVFAKWFAPVLRVGGKGGEEHVLDLKPVSPGQAKTYEAAFRPRSDGEVFMFVNDAVWGLPFIYGNNYANNHGAASVKIEHLDPVR
jgi:uncharacterized protein (DUF2235 family)